MGSGASKKEGFNERQPSKEKKALIKSLTGHTGGINCMDITGNLLLTGSDDRTARLWNLSTFECKVVLEGHTGYISCCKLWQEGYALTGSSDKSILKWNCASGNCILKLERHRGMVNRLLIYGNSLFSSSYDGTVICWNLKTGEECQTYTGHSKSILPIAYIENDECETTKGDELGMTSDSLITGSMDKTARLWSISSATSLRNFRGHKGAVLCLAVDMQNNMLFTGSSDNTIRKWNLLTGEPIKVFKGHEGSIICLQMHHRLLYSASVDATARCWVAEFGDTTRKYVGHDHMVADMKYYHGTVYTGSGDSSVRAFDAKSGNLKKTFKGHKFPVNCLLPFDDMILSGSYDGTVKVWSIKDLIRKNVGGSELSVGSSLRSSATTTGRRASDSTSESDASMRNSKSSANGRLRGSRSTFEITNEVAAAKSRGRQRRSRAPRVAPMSGQHNNNNNSDLDCGYITDKLQNMIDDDCDRWTRSSFGSSTASSTQHYRSGYASTSSYSGQSMQSSADRHRENPAHQRESATNRSNSILVKRESSDYLTKRPRTDSEAAKSLGQADISLVDEELQALSSGESGSITSGYRTADNSPTTPKPKPRQKSSVSFSPNVSMKENDWDSKSYRSSRIPTLSSANARRQSDSKGSDRELKSSSPPGYNPRLDGMSVRAPVAT